MTTIESYNQILAYSGEEPISDLNTPDYTVNLISSQYDVVKRSILAMGFSFNTNTTTLSPDTNSQISLPTGTISVRFAQGNDSYVIKNGVVWDNVLGVNVSTAQKVKLVSDITFEQIPEPFQQWITYEIAAAFRFRRMGLDQSVAYLKQMAVKCKAIALNSEPSNLDGSIGWGRIIAAYGA